MNAHRTGTMNESPDYLGVSLRVSLLYQLIHEVCLSSILLGVYFNKIAFTTCDFSGSACELICK